MTHNRAMLMLLGAAFFWGMAFIAQKNAMNYMGPLTFVAVRYLLGGLILLPFAIKEYQRASVVLTSKQRQLIALLCVSFFFGSWFQQWGLLTTSVTNSGFLTGIYVLFVPLIQWAVFKHRPHTIIWICASVAFLGLFLLSGGNLSTFVTGDYLVLASSFFWAVQVFLLGYLLPKIKLPIFVLTICLLTSGPLSAVGALATETVTLQIVQAGWLEILLAAVFSTAIGFSLQSMGQQYVPAANAAIIVSAESLFAAAGGALLLGERLTGLGYVGVALVFIAIVAVEAIPAHARRNAKQVS